MKTTLSERDGNTVKLAVEVSSEELQEAFSVRLRQLSREVNIPGFRPGKAPAAMVRQRLGDEAILADAVEESMAGWFAKAAAELGIAPVDQPQIELDDDIPELEKPLGFKATVTVMPELVLGEYKGVKALRDPAEVRDEEVDAQIDRMRNELAELRPVEGRAAQMGDFVTADFHADSEGTQVDTLEAVDYAFELGSNRMFPEVEEQIVGMSAGEEKTFPLSLPEGLCEDIKSRKVDFSIGLKEIKEKVLPRPTDQWASEVSEFATLLELRQQLRKMIQAGKTRSSDQLFRARAIQAAADNAAVDLPDVVVREQAEEMLDDFRRSVESQGSSFEAYLEGAGMSIEQMIEDVRPTAANNAKTGLMLDAVAKAEGIAATEEEIGTAVAQMAAVAGRIDAKALEDRLRKSGRIETLRWQIVRDKAADIIVANAVEEAPAPDAEAAVEEAAPKAKAAPKPKAPKAPVPETAVAETADEAVKEDV